MQFEISHEKVLNELVSIFWCDFKIEINAYGYFRENYVHIIFMYIPLVLK